MYSIALYWTARVISVVYSRDHFVNVVSQWEPTLHCNTVSHWLGAYTEWSLYSTCTEHPLARCYSSSTVCDHYSDVIMGTMVSQIVSAGLECLFNRLFRHRSKRTSKLRVTGLCEGNSPGTGKFPSQRASNAKIKKCFHLMTSSCVRYKCMCGFKNLFVYMRQLHVQVPCLPEHTMKFMMHDYNVRNWSLQHDDMKEKGNAIVSGSYRSDIVSLVCSRNCFDQWVKLEASRIISHHCHHAGISQWETTSHCNVASHWLSPYPEWSLTMWCTCHGASFTKTVQLNQHWV